MLRVMVRLVADAVLVASLLFLSAGTLAWPRAWVLLAVLVLIRALGARAVYRVNPGLLRERAGLPMHKDQPRADRLLLLGVLATGFLGLPIIAGLDRFRWHALPQPSVDGRRPGTRPVRGWLDRQESRASCQRLCDHCRPRAGRACASRRGVGTVWRRSSSLLRRRSAHPHRPWLVACSRTSRCWAP